MNPEHDGLIYSKEGKPFVNDQVANAAITRLGLDRDVHSVVQVEGGWAIKKNAAEDQGAKPEKPSAGNGGVLSEVLRLKDEFPGFFAEACRSLGFINPKLVKDPAAALQRAAAFEPDAGQARALLPVLKGIIVANAQAEKIHKVRFSAKSNPNDLDEVVLCVNGERLVLMREADVFLPGRFVEAARNAFHTVYRQRPGEGRKVAGRILSYPFTEIPGDWTMDDFLAQRNAGTEATRKNLETGTTDAAAI